MADFYAIFRYIQRNVSRSQFFSLIKGLFINLRCKKKKKKEIEREREREREREPPKAAC
jgi:hypothetical protein